MKEPFNKIEGLLCTPDRIRTCNRWSRNPVLYPVEPRVHRFIDFARVSLQEIYFRIKEFFYDLYGTLSIMYSANAVIVKLGFTPKLIGTIEPSTT